MGVEPTPERTRPDTDFEDQEAHRDLTIPRDKDNSGEGLLSTRKLGRHTGRDKARRDDGVWRSVGVFEETGLLKGKRLYKVAQFS